MSKNSIESIIEDFIKGAREGGFKGNVQVQRDGDGKSEVKLASDMSPLKQSSLDEAYSSGYTAALQKLGFLGTAASMMAPALLRKAAPALGKRLGTGLMGQVADTGITMGAQHLADKAGLS